MRVLVTGAGGFVGRSLVRALGDAHEVVALDMSCAGLRVARAVEGDIADPAIQATATAEPLDAIVHLATVPGGAAEADPRAGWRVNMDASFGLIEAAARHGNRPRVLFASSIAVFGDPLPASVDDATPLRPRMLYGAHKAMMEQWIATLTRRGAIDGLSLRLPGIVARPRGPSGMKSAFMSDVFHALAAGERFVSPVLPEATMWLMSVTQIARNFRLALELDRAPAEPHAVTLPAVRCTMAELVGETAARAGVDPALVAYAPEPPLEAGFGRQPPLTTAVAEALGFASDGSLAALVEAVLAEIGSVYE